MHVTPTPLTRLLALSGVLTLAGSAVAAPPTAVTARLAGTIVAAPQADPPVDGEADEDAKPVKKKVKRFHSGVGSDDDEAKGDPPTRTAAPKRRAGGSDADAAAPRRATGGGASAASGGGEDGPRRRIVRRVIRSASSDANGPAGSIDSGGGAELATPAATPAEANAPQQQQYGYGTLNVELIDGLLCVRDPGAELDVIAPNLHPFWKGNPAKSIEPMVETTMTDAGIDVRFTFHNHTNTPKELGHVAIGGIRFGEDIESRMIELEGKRTELSHNGSTYFGGGAYYPGRLYSPVAVVRDGDYTIGVSLQYELLEYQHHVFVRVESPGGQYTHGGRNRQVLMKLNPSNSDRYNPDGDLQPGETREYVMSVRVHKGDPNEWVRTLLPYREFFQQTYGGPRYERDPRPVAGLALANTRRLRYGNPRGFNRQQTRPDLHGWGPMTGVFQEFVDDGYDRLMVIVPSGLFRAARLNNFPFVFATGLRDGGPMEDTLPQLAAFAGSGVELGMWWGNSAKVMQGWDTYEWERFDPTDPQHRAAAFAEMDAAIDVNTTCVGLDAMSQLPSWVSYPWIVDLQEKYPNVRFVVEAMAEDVMHTLGPTYVWATRPLGMEEHQANEPHFLADFLVPGHETWARVDAGVLKQWYNLPSTSPVPERIMLDHIAKTAAKGYVPVVHGRCEVPKDLLAAESWLQTVPEDLR